MIRILNILLVITLLPFAWALGNAQPNSSEKDNQKKEQELLQDAKVEAARKEIEITVRNVEITKFPEIKIIIEAYNRLGEPLDSLSADALYVYEKGVPRKVIKVEKIPIAEKVAVDFVYVVDVTGSMQQCINQVRSNIMSFTQHLAHRGISYRIGLVLFNDDVTKVYQPTDNVNDFIGWLSGVKAFGGGDEKENALEALNALTRIKFRDEANKVAVVVTDAPYHQRGETGQGTTNYTTESIIETMQKNEIRVFSIVPPKLTNYATISKRTRGNVFDIDFPFSTILDNFSNQLTNLFILTYKSGETVVPDSIEIALFDKNQSKLIKKSIPIVELGRKLIIENLLFGVNRFDLPENVDELNILGDFIQSKPNISILVEGHTDSKGPDATNDILSQQRAESVKAYLMKRGVAESRISTKGYGERKPIASNKDDFGRQLNRRTEIIITSK